jgi:hypothetical protein
MTAIDSIKQELFRGIEKLPATQLPEVLQFVLVTNNRKSMPVHLIDDINQDRHVPGIFILNSNQSIGKNIEELIVIAECSFDREYQDRIIHLPRT